MEIDPARAGRPVQAQRCEGRRRPPPSAREIDMSRIRAAFCGATLALGMTVVTPSGPAHAESPSAGEVLACVGDPAGCVAAQDAARWALGVAQSRYAVVSLEDGSGDAFRHCAWSGALTQRVGDARAEAITTRHEYARQPASYSAQAMDFGNNYIGRWVGARSGAEGGSDTWGWIIDRCAQLQAAGWLYGLGYDPFAQSSTVA